MQRAGFRRHTVRTSREAVQDDDDRRVFRKCALLRGWSEVQTAGMCGSAENGCSDEPSTHMVPPSSVRMSVLRGGSGEGVWGSGVLLGTRVPVAAHLSYSTMSILEKSPMTQ